MTLHYVYATFVFINLLIVAFHTNITVHFFNQLFKLDAHTREDINLWMLSKQYYTLAEWYSCPLCLGTWLAFAIGIVTACVTTVPVWFPILFAISVPWIGYTVLKLIEKL